MSQDIVPTSDDLIKMQLERRLQSAIRALEASTAALRNADDVTHKSDANAVSPVLDMTIPSKTLRASENDAVRPWPGLVAVAASRPAQPQIASLLPQLLSVENGRMGTAVMATPASIQSGAIPPQPRQRDEQEDGDDDDDDSPNVRSDSGSGQDHDRDRYQSQDQDQHEEAAAPGLPHDVQMAAFRLHSRNGKWINVFRKLRQDIYASKLSGVMQEMGLKKWDILNLSMNELRHIWRVTHRRWHSSARCRVRTSRGAADDNPDRNQLPHTQQVREVDQN